MWKIYLSVSLSVTVWSWCLWTTLTALGDCLGCPVPDYKQDHSLKSPVWTQGKSSFSPFVSTGLLYFSLIVYFTNSWSSAQMFALPFIRVINSFLLFFFLLVKPGVVFLGGSAPLARSVMTEAICDERRDFTLLWFNHCLFLDFSRLAAWLAYPERRLQPGLLTAVIFYQPYISNTNKTWNRLINIKCSI